MNHVFTVLMSGKFSSVMIVYASIRKNHNSLPYCFIYFHIIEKIHFFWHLSFILLCFWTGWGGKNSYWLAGIILVYIICFYGYGKLPFHIISLVLHYYLVSSWELRFSPEILGFSLIFFSSNSLAEGIQSFLCYCHF